MMKSGLYKACSICNSCRLFLEPRCSFATSKFFKNNDDWFPPNANIDFCKKWRQMYSDITKHEQAKKPKFEPAVGLVGASVMVLESGAGSMASLAVTCRKHNKTSVFDHSGNVRYNHFCNMKARLKVPSSLFFSSVNISNILTSFDYSGFEDGLTTVYGPKGIHKAVTSTLVSVLSSVRYNEIIANLAFTELHSDTLDVQDGDISIKMISVEAQRMPTVSYLINVTTAPRTASLTECELHGVDFNKEFNDFYSEEDFNQYNSFLTRLKSMKPAINPETGLIVNPEDIFTSPEDCKMLYVCCPSPAHLAELYKNPHFSEMEDVKLVAHMVPDRIASSYQYREWVKRFSSSYQHLWLNKNADTFLFPDIQRKVLHEIDPVLFPLHGQNYSLEKISEALSGRSEHPHKPYEYTIFREIKERAPKIERFQKLLNNTNKYIELLKTIKIKKKDIMTKVEYPRLVVLGSGGSHITVVRGQPCYLLQTTPKSSILIDCGLTSLTQLYRHFGPNEMSRVLSTIKAIFISHRHSDHFCGLPEVMKKIRQYCEHSQLKIFLPSLVKGLTTKVSQQCGMDFEQSIFPVDRPGRFEHAWKETERDLEIDHLIPVQVDHGVTTHGLVVQGKDWKIVYSSDTLPMCKNLITAGRGADLLLHDSLYIHNEMRLESKLKRHSVSSDAIKTAHAMQAKNVLLTHFSSMNLPVLPIDLQDKGNYKGNVLYAMDHMELTLSTLARFPLCHKHAQEVFKSQILHYHKRASGVEKKAESLQRAYDQIKKFKKTQNYN